MKSPLSYLGGKSRLAKRIIERMPVHEAYVEVFAGAGWVFFRKDPGKVEVLNDINSDLVVFWRVLQNHLEEFCKQFKWLLVSREWWEDWERQAAAGGLTDIQRAARFYYLQRLGFGGKVAKRTFGVSVGKPRINLLRMEEELSETHVRLAGATIEHLPYAECIRRYDRPGTLFYLDPPYWGCEGDYGKAIFSRDDFARLAEQLAGIKGKFLLSLNDVPEVRETFGAFVIGELKTTYTVAKGPAKRVNEVLIQNF